jgi:hypothetical protein
MSEMPDYSSWSAGQTEERAWDPIKHERHSEQSGDTYTVSIPLEKLVTLTASLPFYRKLVCLSPGDEIIEVALVFLDRTSDTYSAIPAIVEEI